jgi:hypothetical protein
MVLLEDHPEIVDVTRIITLVGTCATPADSIAPRNIVVEETIELLIVRTEELISTAVFRTIFEFQLLTLGIPLLERVPNPVSFLSCREGCVEPSSDIQIGRMVSAEPFPSPIFVRSQEVMC